MSEIKYGNFKIDCITYQLTSKRPEKNVTNNCSYKFSLCIRSCKKRLNQWNARKCSIKVDFNQNGSLSIS